MCPEWGPICFLLIGIQIFNIKYGGKELKSTKEDNKNISLIIDKRGGGRYINY